MPATIQDVIKRLTVVHTTPGAENAARRIRDVGSAMREASSSSVTYERAARASDAANVRGLAQMQAYTRALRESAIAQRALTYASGNMGTAVGLAGGYVGYVAAAAGIAMLVNRAAGATEAYRKFEDQQITLQAALNMTDRAAGRSAEQLGALVREIGDISNARQAVQIMLSYQRVQEDIFDTAMRRAKDLSATGFGDLQSSAKAVGAALQDPAQGLAALEAAGIRFGVRQKALIIDMAETGRAAEAQVLTLQLLQDRIGGTAAARDGTLTGALVHLSDASQRSNEQLGEIIVTATHLVGVLNSLARVMEWVNDINLSKIADKFSFWKGPLWIAADVVDALTSVDAEIEKKITAQQKEANSITGLSQPLRQQQKAYEAVILQLEKERRAIQQTNLEREIERRQHAARVDAASEMGQSIAREVVETERLRKAKEDQAAAEKAAEDAAKRALALSLQRALQARQSLETAQLEIDLVGRSIAQQTDLRANLQARHQLEQDAARTRTTFDQAEYERLQAINAELARRAQLRAMTELRSEIKFDTDTALLSSTDQQIASRLRQIYGGEWRAHMDDAIAQQMRFNDVLKQTNDAGREAFTSLAQAMRDGKLTGDELASVLDSLSQRLMQMAADSVWNYLIKGAGAGDGGLFGGLFSGIFGSADGNIIDRGRITPFAAGGVVGMPTYFPLANGGLGLAGEAGPEAIMPLRRGPDGRLGVDAAGGSQQQNVTISFAVDARGSQQGAGDEIVRAMKSFVESPAFRAKVVSAVADAKSRRRV